MTKQAKTETANRDTTLIWTWALAVAVVLFTVIVRIRLLGIPLERDEGEFAYIGQLMLEGIPPYKLAYSMKLPGIYALYALIMSVFGQTAVGIHIGLLVANLASVTLVFALGRRLWDTRVALVAAASFAILSLGGPVLGISGHATQFLLPLVLGGILLLLKALDAGRLGLLFLGGVLLGLGFMVKQHSLAFSVFGLCIILHHAICVRSLAMRAVLIRLGLYTAGVAIPFDIAYMLLQRAGVTDRFWFWTFTYARQYASEISPMDGLQILLTQAAPSIIVPSILLAILSVIGFIALFRNREFGRHKVFTLSFLVLSFLAVCPGFYFRGHYWVQMLPAVSLLTGLGVAWMFHWACKRNAARWLQAIPLLVLLLAVAHVVTINRAVFFAPTPEDACRVLFTVNPFPEAIEVARYLREHSSPDDRIAILGSEPEILFYANRISATGHIYMYGLMEPQPFALWMQEETIKEIETAKPRYMVYIDSQSSWLMDAQSHRLITEWFPEYCDRFYKIVGAVQMHSPERAEYVWGEEAESFASAVNPHIYVFERRSGI